MLDLASSATGCNSYGDLQKLVENLKNIIGADFAFCAMGLEDERSKLLLSSVSTLPLLDKWLLEYLNDKEVRQSPVLIYLSKDAKALYGEKKFKAQKRMVGKKSWVVPFKLKPKDLLIYVTGRELKCIFCFGNLKGCFKAQHKRAVIVALPHIQEAFLTVRERLNWIEDNLLTGREREIIGWMKEGKTNWEVATILEIRERTVKFHVGNIVKKLNASNKTHAVAIAIEKSLL
ncbi:MAG: helix-turn-helix transcriptional regulator [Deltaproteobacteria bacterium]|nr:helix-turn-helix transcriptional regulator [Deltaproteobacteria bacterium]